MTGKISFPIPRHEVISAADEQLITIQWELSEAWRQRVEKVRRYFLYLLPYSTTEKIMNWVGISKSVFDVRWLRLREIRSNAYKSPTSNVLVDEDDIPLLFP